MYTHEPHTSEILGVSSDGRRTAPTAGIVHTQSEAPSYYQEDTATNAALENADFSYGMGDMSLPVEEQIHVIPPVKKKRYDNSVRDTLSRAVNG